jgi:hypothetical protein
MLPSNDLFTVDSLLFNVQNSKVTAQKSYIIFARRCFFKRILVLLRLVFGEGFPKNCNYFLRWSQVGLTREGLLKGKD